MMPSSSRETERGPVLVGASVAQDRIRHGGPPPGRGDERPVVPLALVAFAVVQGPGGRVAPQSAEGRPGGGALEGLVPALRPREEATGRRTP